MNSIPLQDNLIKKKNNLSIPEYAFKIDSQLKTIKIKVEDNFLEMASCLKEVRDNKLYEILNFKSFESYIAQPELAMDRTTVYKLIRVYEIFIEKYNVYSSIHNKIGWVKLDRIAPFITDDNYKYYLEKAETLSLSDLNTELKEKGLITYKEQETQHIECPNCHYVFNPKLRKETSFKQENYNKVIKKYEEIKETKFEGKEYDPIMQNIKTLFLNGRTPEEIIATIEWLGENAEYEWTINTVKNKIAEILPKIQPKLIEINEEDRRLMGL